MSRREEVEAVGLVAEVEALGLAQEVAVDLVGERAVAGDGELVDVGAVVDPARPVRRQRPHRRAAAMAPAASPPQRCGT